ncbi:MAG TPA: 4Fe-4S dicluster domain-containing protein [Amycolatopsis sp.]|jgi:formate dehydrogenase iron-sulfur subunit|nr:4Fe-4S dicluster domain-containing protein [Amycolatopsis sp.]
MDQGRVGFFTDTSVCIGCKACEVACKEWNNVPEDGLDLLGMSYDNTGGLGANSWRHVAFIEREVSLDREAFREREASVEREAALEREGSVGHAASLERERVDLGLPAFELPGAATGGETRSDFGWLMSSDVCKHCTHAGCLDVCPTGALFRTEFGTVVVQPDICNGCGYCVSACPYGVIDRREDDGRAWKCTLCYDRLGDGLEPACAKACPTDSIQFGPLDELRERAERRVADLRDEGVTQARLYGHDPRDGVGGDGAFFLLLDVPEVYGLPPDPVVPTRELPSMWRYAGLAASALLAAAVNAFWGGR